MSDATAGPSPPDDLSGATPRLRADLKRITVQGARRSYELIVDEVAGNFIRLPQHLWESLQAGEADDRLWAQARSAGWTRERGVAEKAKSSWLYFHVPLFAANRIAAFLARHTDGLFARRAVICWTGVILIALALALSHLGEITASLGSLGQFLAQANPVVVFAVFAMTKAIHELAHATVCHRVGARCGRIGVLFMCGMPCPYCDVTDVWRQPAPMARAAVMFAGIYVELILAALATFVWLATDEPTIRFWSLNLMIVCGVSTILFNANPLMRYDGYFILSDLLGSANLRQEAHRAYRSVLVSRIAGQHFELPPRSDRRGIVLTIYHLASTIYRLVITLAIATLVYAVASWLYLQAIAVVMIAMTVVKMIRGYLAGLIGIWRGADGWSSVSDSRRRGIVGLVAVLLVAVLLVPLPRYRHANGWIDAADAVSVFVRAEGVVERVGADYGDHVGSGQSLVHVQNDRLVLSELKHLHRVEQTRIKIENDRASIVSQGAASSVMEQLIAEQQSAKKRLDLVQQQIADLDIRSAVAGIVVPPTGQVAPDQAKPVWSLHERVGSATNQHDAWCRISPAGKLQAVLEIDARDRSKIIVGTNVAIQPADRLGQVIHSTVESVSAIEADEPSVVRQAAYRVVCRLNVDTDPLVSWIGKPCRAVFQLQPKSLLQSARDSVDEWLRG